MKRALVVLAGAALLATLVRSHAERRAAALPVSSAPILLSPRWAPLLTLGFDALAADLLWIRFTQRIPNRPADPELGRLLASDLETVVTLDPRFREAYVHGSTLLSVLGSQPCAALAVAQKGGEEFPNDWRLAFNAGYICFIELGDNECAAREMTRAASIPGSPRWLPGLVARLLADSQQIDRAIDYLEVQHARTEDPRLKEVFGERLAEARLTRDLLQLDQALREFVRVRGRVPASMDELRAAGLAAHVPPADPFGGQYVLRDGKPATTSGREPLRAYRQEPGLIGEMTERLLEERVEGRLSRYLGPRWTVSPVADRLGAAAGVPEAGLLAATALLEVTDDPARRTQLYVLAARAMIRRDLLLLRAAQLELLRDRKGEPPRIEEIAERAGVRSHDPFGGLYVLDRDGLPAPAVSREPIVAVRGAAQTRACR